MRVPVVLHGMSSFDQDILESSAVPLAKGLSRCIAGAGPLRSEITISPDFWSILQRLHQHEESAPIVFELLQSIVDSTPPTLTADNYEAAVSLANDFASAGSVGSIEERQRDALARRTKGAVKPLKIRYGHFPLNAFFFRQPILTQKQRKSNRGPRCEGDRHHLPDDKPCPCAYSAVTPREERRSVETVDFGVMVRADFS